MSASVVEPTREPTPEPDPAPTGRWLTAGQRFALQLVLGLVLRLLAAASPGYRGDVATFRFWAERLRRVPIGDFYRGGVGADHLPGDLWLVRAVAYLPSGPGDVALRLVPVVADLGCAAVLFSLVARLGSRSSALRVTGWYLVSPAAIVAGALWGQWDSFSALLVLVALRLAVARRGWWLAPTPLVWAALVKPQLAVVGLAVVCYLVVRLLRPARGRVGRLAVLGGGAALALAVGTALILPWRVGWWWAPSGGTTLARRVHVAVALYPKKTLGAANLWMLPQASLHRHPDDRAGLLGLTAAQWGLIGTIVLQLVVLATVVRRLAPRRGPLDREVTAVWAAAAATFAGFEALTRIHERYLFITVVLVLVLCGLRPADQLLRRLWWALNVALTANLLLSLTIGLSYYSHSPAWTVTFETVTLVVLGCFLTLLAWPWVSGPDRTAPASASVPAPVPAPAPAPTPAPTPTAAP